MRPRSGSSRRRAAGALLAALLTACTSQPQDPRPTGAPSPTPTTPPAPAGTVAIAVPDEPATLDPFAPAGGAVATRDIARLLMPALYRLDPAGARAPWLLAAEPERIDARTLRLRLRDDARWSDGRPVTIDDLEHTRAHAVANDVDGYDAIAAIVEDEPGVTTLTFRGAVPEPFDLFSAGLGVLPAHVPVEQLARAWPVTGGSFVLRRWRPGLDILLEADPRALEPPRAQRLRFVFVPDATGALELLRRGEVDVLGPYLAPDWTRRVSEVSGAAVSASTGQSYAALVLDTRRAPFSDRRVRRALAHAIDRGRIARGLVGAEGEALDAVPPGGADGFEAYGDLVHARALLTRAGWSGSPRRKSGATLDPTVAFVGDDLTYTVVRAIQFQARQAGFDLQAVPLDTRQLWDEWLGSREQRAAVLVLRDPATGARARFGIGSADAASSVSVLPLFAVTVVLAAADGIAGPCASASPDGPFWNAQTWSERTDQPAGCPTLLPAAA